MGLDMYFTARQFLSEFDDADKEMKTNVSALSKGIASEWDVEEVTYEVGYWRKANAIHNWFVQNVQDGEDDCKSYHVSHDSILELYNTVIEVLEDHSKAEDLLPPQSGFFFGNTSIDEWYFSDLEHTKKILEPIVERIQDDDKVKELYDYSFYYQSSW